MKIFDLYKVIVLPYLTPIRWSTLTDRPPCKLSIQPRSRKLYLFSSTLYYDFRFYFTKHYRPRINIHYVLYKTAKKNYKLILFYLNTNSFNFNFPKFPKYSLIHELLTSYLLRTQTIRLKLQQMKDLWKVILKLVNAALIFAALPSWPPGNTSRHFVSSEAIDLLVVGHICPHRLCVTNHGQHAPSRWRHWRRSSWSRRLLLLCKLKPTYGNSVKMLWIKYNDAVYLNQQFGVLFVRVPVLQFPHMQYILQD